VSPGARDFISHLLVKDPSKRMSLEDVLKNPWLVESAKDAVL
jgi:aurora kinase